MNRTVSFRTFYALCTAVLLFTTVQPLRADWFRDFDDGTTQGLVEWDLVQILAGIDEFSIYAVDGALRMDFNAVSPFDPNNNSGGAYDTELFETVSARMLIKWSGNPGLHITDGILNAGWTLRFNPNLATIAGYTFYLSNAGQLELGRLFPNPVTGLPDYQRIQEIWLASFNSSYDWWLVAECIPLNSGELLLRAKTWQDGTPEICEWAVEALQPNPSPPGMVGFGADEDPDTGDGQFVDVDHLSVTTAASCTERCDNRLDDDLDGRIDCEDSDCVSASHCQCSAPFADLDADGDVDQDDFGVWQLCYTGAGVSRIHEDDRCGCLDRDDMDANNAFHRVFDGDGDVDLDDLTAFLECVSGPAIAANPACGG